MNIRSIIVKFHDGHEVVEGRIIDRKGDHRFVVTSGHKTFTFVMARTLEQLKPLQWAEPQKLIPIHPYCTIPIEVDYYPGEEDHRVEIEHIYKFTEKVCFTVEGSRYFHWLERDDIRVPRHG